VTDPHGPTRTSPGTAQRQTTVPLAVVILAQNEEENIPHALASVIPWAAEVWVIDANSTDRTADLARAAGARVVTHEWAGGGAQRTWALRTLPFQQDWLLFLDADERVTPHLRDELASVLSVPPQEISGFYVKRRFIFLGRWLRHGGYYPTWLLRVVRHNLARCEDRWVDEHLVVDGPTGRLRHDILHEDRKPLSRWVKRHEGYADQVVADLEGAREGGPAPRWLSRHQVERKRWWYERVYLGAPLRLRAFAYFLYRYILRGGFLDGPEGLIYHSLQGLWYRRLIDAKMLQAHRSADALRGGHAAPVRTPDPADR